MARAALILDITFGGRPPSKNVRTRFNRRTGIIHTETTARTWMRALADLVRHVRQKPCPPKTPMVMVVEISVEKGFAMFDLDGALSCLVDAVLAGLADDAVRPPDQWVSALYARKRLDRTRGPYTRVRVYGQEGRKEATDV